jgi:hypothetical protein
MTEQELPCRDGGWHGRVVPEDHPRPAHLRRGEGEEFYVGFLGFGVDWEHRFEENTPAYIQVSRDGLVLYLSEHHGDCCPGSTVFVWMAGAEDGPGGAAQLLGVKPTTGQVCMCSCRFRTSFRSPSWAA